MLPASPRSPVLLDTESLWAWLPETPFQPVVWEETAANPQSIPTAQVEKEVKAQDGLGPLLVAEDVTSEPLSSLFQSLHLENKKINIQLERFNLLTRSREAVGTIKCHAKLIMPAPGTVYGMQ